MEAFTCKAKYISALSAAAGGTVENIVVENEEAAKKAYATLRKIKEAGLLSCL